MNIKYIIESAMPKAGLSHLLATYLNWAGVGFLRAFIAGGLDKRSEVLYAAYYTGAVNEAIGFKFWVLLIVIGILLFCGSLPIIYLAHHVDRFQQFATRLRRFTYMFFLVAFDEGGLMIGILLANFFHASDKTALLAAKSFLFSDVGFFSILLLAFLNSLLWLVGESVYNSQDRSYSGIVRLIMDKPLKYTLPAYLIFTGVALYLIIGRQ